MCLCWSVAMAQWIYQDVKVQLLTCASIYWTGMTELSMCVELVFTQPVYCAGYAPFKNNFGSVLHIAQKGVKPFVCESPNAEKIPCVVQKRRKNLILSCKEDHNKFLMQNSLGLSLYNRKDCNPVHIIIVLNKV